MALPSGTRLGPYEILPLLGVGGMGEVYRARDTRLERTVAIKILSQLSSDPGRRQRFEREAKAISCLNHPNICTLHDIGHQDGIDYLVMECLEGETLAKRLEKGPLPVEQVLKYGVQIADALDKAHRSGIVHRDLKPSNIMLTSTGAKLLDFGLAKPASPLVHMATMTATKMETPVTEQGTIVGTFQYMSPEQVEGREVDGRSDIFSLGAVLYEMITDQRAFEGKSQLSVASAILEKEPAPITTLKPLTPPALDHAIRNCLAKNPDERWQTAKDLSLELNWIAVSGPEGLANPPEPLHPRRTTILLWGALSLLLAAATGTAAWTMRPQPPPQPVSRTVITLPPGQHLTSLNERVLALSQDGTQLAYVALQGEKQQIYLRSMDNPQPRAIPGTEGGTSPFFSPDGQWLAFFANQKLKKVSLDGGGVITLADATNPHGGSWSSEGTIAFPSASGALQQTPDTATASQPLSRGEKDEVAHRNPEFLPGGKSLLYVTSTSSFNWGSDAHVVAQRGMSDRRNLVTGAVSPQYASSGHLLVAQEGNILAAPFDAERLMITGPFSSVVEGVLQSRFSGVAQYAVSRNGSLAFVSGGVQTDQRRMVWVERNGKDQVIGAPVRAYLFPRISPNGQHVAVTVAEATTQVWSYDLFRETLTRMTFEGNQNSNPVWSPDSKRIAFRSLREGGDSILSEPAEGGQSEKLFADDHSADAPPLPVVPMSWSPDGQTLAFLRVGQIDVWMLSLNERKAKPFLATPFSEGAPRFSPDGRWLAYVSNESGRYEVYVLAYPGLGGKLQISTDGGTEPVWNPKGRELFYRSGNKMMVVDVVTQPTFTAGKPRVLFQGQFLPSPATAPNYDVSPDGQRFLMLKAAEPEGEEPTQINVVFNWFEELKRRVPTTKR
jgi:eukaryotic-like serine/threonine-protein kinase